MFGMNGLELIYNGNQLVIKKPVKTQIWRIVFTIISSVLFLFLVSTAWNTGIKDNLNYLYSFLVVIIILQLYTPVKTLIIKEYFVFDQSSQTIYRKDNIEANFNDVSFVEIEVVSGGEDSDAYKLIIRLKDQSAIKIDKSTKEAEIRRVAGEIATFINKSVKQT